MQAHSWIWGLCTTAGRVDDVTQQNAALVEEASAASHSLMEQASALNQLVARFVVDASAHTKEAGVTATHCVVA